jgi:hypothetical protein
MNGNRYLFFFCLFSVGFVACAQTKYGIKHIYAFSTEQFPGNIAVDEKGNPLHSGADTLNTIYMETGGLPVQWNTAWKNGKTYSVAMRQITSLPFDAGRIRGGNDSVILTVEKGNQLWRIDLLPAEQDISIPQKIKPGEILLRGKYGSRAVFRKMSMKAQLQSIPAV